MQISYMFIDLFVDIDSMYSLEGKQKCCSLTKKSKMEKRSISTKHHIYRSDHC